MRKRHANSYKPSDQYDPYEWMVIDNFAGGGGASTGIKLAIGRDPDAGINHNAEALAIYSANHPDSITYKTSVWETDPRVVVRNRKVGLAHFSPDCTDFSKAKGGQPKRDKSRKSRALAWVVVKWARRTRPRVITLENVEEWLQWGPLRRKMVDGKPASDEQGPLYEPDPTRRGEMFAKWLKQLEKLGYHVEWCELRGCDYGSPTIRKRLFVIARCDGEPIVWPLPTHRSPNSPWVQKGFCKPWRTAAEIIDWSIPCPSIFLSRDEATQLRFETGVRVIRPLDENTMRRIAKGLFRYVINAKKPFIVNLNHKGDGFRGCAIGSSLPTLTCSREAIGVIDPLLSPYVTVGQHKGSNRSAESPLQTVTASTGDKNAVVTPFLVPRYGEAPGQAPRCRSIEDPLATIVPTSNGSQLISPVLADPQTTAFLDSQYGNSAGVSADEPCPTIMPGGGGKVAVVTPFLASPAHSKTTGRAPNHWDINEPLRTQTTTNDKCVIAPILDAYHGDRPDGSSCRSAEVTDPLRTQDTSNRHAMVQAFLAQHNTGVVGHHPEQPLSTITQLGTQQNVVEATFIAQHNGNTVGYPCGDPLGTLTQRSTQHQLVAAHLSHAYTSNTCGGNGDPNVPLKTIVAGGNHHAAVLAFLQKYYGSDGNHQGCDEPLHTIPTRERFGLVTVNEVEYQIVDIGMRMLAARELYNAQGFPPDYKINVWCDDRRGDKGQQLKPGYLTKEAQVRCCGNSVCPQVMEALVTANCPYLLMRMASPAVQKRRRQLELAV